MPTPVQMSCGMYLLHSWYFKLLPKIVSRILLFLYYASISIRIIGMQISRCGILPSLELIQQLSLCYPAVDIVALYLLCDCSACN